MDILYVCNEKMRKSYNLEAIFNKIFTKNNIDSYVQYIPTYSKIPGGLKNNVFLLLDKIMKIMVFKYVI
ncbi:hypothetical protein K9O30_09120 [Clostridium bowmanii]|uniref:hypothetical protein n=1 Tax=Clostridium bowmanii TaxID=132925 RepID=UPI001C0D128E|nr:hypothetical protein [Clostridium bowmanii]MBU3189017.1 hypothetical protein [Clostridium bowmanii]MCA1073881.1 hypothetical protein [Clostridium bowmanii]